MMNERFREIAKSASDWCIENAKGTPVAWEWEEKFAELIVRECARIVPDTDLGDVDGGDSAVLRAASKQIREHFGVE
jgi:hypothetical protein